MRNSRLDQLEKEKDSMFLQARFGIYRANSEGNRIIFQTSEGEIKIPCLRQQKQKPEGKFLALSDFVMPQSENRTDYVGAFVVTISPELASRIEQLKRCDDHYETLMLQHSATEWSKRQQNGCIIVSEPVTGDIAPWKSHTFLRCFPSTIKAYVRP